MAESPHGRIVALLALVAGALGALAGALLVGADRIRAGLAVGASAALLVAVGARQWQYLVDGNVNWTDWSVTLAVSTAGWLVYLFALRAFVSHPATLYPIPRPLGLLLMLCCAYVCLGLVFAGRHRDFPVWLFLPGVLAFVITALAHPRARGTALRSSSANEEVLLAVWLVVAGVAIPLLERMQNMRALGSGAVERTTWPRDPRATRPASAQAQGRRRAGRRRTT